MKTGGSVYILTNVSNNVLYIGVTAQLYIRIQEHIQGKYQTSFSNRYNCKKLVYFENFITIQEAIAREKQLKNWHRSWKLNLINNFNPIWRDLTDDLVV